MAAKIKLAVKYLNGFLADRQFEYRALIVLDEVHKILLGPCSTDIYCPFPTIENI